MKSSSNDLNFDVINNNLRLFISMANDSSRRTRWILVILITASCLALACFWNSLQSSWKHKRVETMRNYITYLDKVAMAHNEHKEYRVQFMQALRNCLNYDTSAFKSVILNKQVSNDSLLKCFPFLKILQLQEHLFGKEITPPAFDTSFLADYYGKDALGLSNLRLMFMIYWLSEAKDIKSFKIPFFDVNFDINDLGFIGGLGFSIILLLFYLSLIREKENVKIAFKASKLEFDNNYENRRQFYYLFSMNQLIIMPHVMNKKGKRHFKILPLTLLIFPFLFSLCVFFNDIKTNSIGVNISTSMTYFEYWMSGLFLLIIIIFTVICFLEVYSIDRIWKAEKIWLDDRQKEEQSDNNTV